MSVAEAEYQNKRHKARRETKKLYDEINSYLAEHDLMLTEGSIEDPSIISAPGSTKNAENNRDPEMHQTRKGNQWCFGMKLNFRIAMNRLGVLLFLFTWISMLQADTPAADLALDVEIEPGGVMLPGSAGIAILKISNNGPDDSPAFIGWGPTDNGVGLSYPPLGFTGVNTGPCGVSPVGQPIPGNFFGFQITVNIPPEEFVTCTYGFTIRETMVASQIAQWGTSPFGPAEDLNRTNNSDEVLLIFSPLADMRPVPSASWVGVLALVFMIVLLGIRRLI